jgi:iron complex outermembrane recepter protein
MALDGTTSFGSFNTRLLDLQFDSGDFGGGDSKNRLLIEGHQMKSDGYQTYNYQDRDAFSAKYQLVASDKTTVSA